MVCLNLPPELLFKAENMFVAGIIPAPSQPSSTELNHYVRPPSGKTLWLWHVLGKFRLSRSVTATLRVSESLL